MFRSYNHLQTENILLARITQLTMDPLDQTDHYDVNDILKQRIRCQLSNSGWIYWIKPITMMLTILKNRHGQPFLVWGPNYYSVSESRAGPNY
jgi:hypothetical protein